MNITELNKQLEKIDLDSDKKGAILNIIDIKTTNDMKEVIKEIQVFKSDMDSKFAAIDSKFVSLRSDMLTNRWIITIIGVVVATITAISRIL